MKQLSFILLLLCISLTVVAQGHHSNDSTDVFFRHMELDEVTVTSATGNVKIKQSTTPISLVTQAELHQKASGNIIDAIAQQPGISQITTGGAISKPIIRGLGYNRIVVINDGVRQEGQQWGDEHGIEVDAASVHSVEVLKGPASLMYGSDAMAGVLIFHSAPIQPEGKTTASVSSEYQTNNGLFGYSAGIAGNQRGFVWNARYSGKAAHAYKNKRDGYVPGSQFYEQSGRLMLGLNKHWGYTHLTASLFHQTPSIAEGERDEETGELEHAADNVKTYSKTLPFQRINHFKTVWDNSLNLPHGNLKLILGYQQNQRKEYEESADESELYFRLHTATYDLRYLTHDFNGWKLAAGMGGMWQQSQNLAEETLIPAYRLFDIGGYATVSKSAQHWTFNGGLRYDHRHLDFHHRNFNSLTGSAGAIWNVTDHMNLRLNVARGFRAPNMSELGSDGVHEGTLRYELGNRNLKPEYSWQADMGIDFTSQYVSAQVALFANRIENYIFAKRIDETIDEDYLTYTYTQGDARLLGFEAGVDVHPIHSIHFKNTFSYVDARQMHADADTRYLPMTPPARWTTEAKYEFTHHGHTVLNNAYAAVSMEYNLAQNHYYRADDTETRTPSYAVVKLSVGTDLNIRKRKVAELYITADNIFNYAYQSHLSRLKYTDVNPVTGHQGVCNMGRNIVFKIVIPTIVL